MSYGEYRRLIVQLLAENKTTGTDQSEEMVAYARLNHQRMQRIEKSCGINEELKQILVQLKKPLLFVVLSEGWCGDAAQNLPVLAAMESAGDKIELKILLRDENPDVMNLYLTNSARAIPKLICFDRESGEELFTWGPRPKACQILAKELTEKNVPKKEKGEQIHLWYARDRTQTLQAEMVELLNS